MVDQQDKRHPVWAPIDFEGDVYDASVIAARVVALRDGINRELSGARQCLMYTGPTPNGRPLAEQVAENYRVLLRRIDELQRDLDEVLELTSQGV